VRWCLTAPAGLSQSSMHIMRRAAMAAGLIPSTGSPSLLITSEPEAAAFTAHKRKDLPGQELVAGMPCLQQCRQSDCRVCMLMFKMPLMFNQYYCFECFRAGLQQHWTRSTVQRTLAHFVSPILVVSAAPYMPCGGWFIPYLRQNVMT
jgi:hypothetical protein